MIGISKKQLYNLETIGDIIFLPRGRLYPLGSFLF